jgi:putative peptidoglycan lipid II flippase
LFAAWQDAIILVVFKRLFLRQTNIFSAAAFIFAAVLVSAALGLVRTRLLSAFFGATRELDIYYAAFRIPDLLFQLLVMGALSAAFIPIFTSLLSTDKQKQAFEFANICINYGMLVFLLFNIVIFFWSDMVCRILAPGFSASDVARMSTLTRIMVSAQIFFIIGNFFTGILHSFNHFILPAVAPIFYNIGIILGILILSPTIGIYGPTIGVVLGTFLFFLIQLPLVLKLKYRYAQNWNYKNPNFIEGVKLMLPRTIGLGASQIEYTSDLMLASVLAAGRYTIFNFAIILMTLPVRLFGASIGQASLPTLSSLFSQGKAEEFSLILKSSLKQIFFLVIPLTVLITVLRVPFVRLAFGAQAFTWDATVLTGKTLAILSLGILGQSATQILLRAFYAAKNTKTPLILSFIAVFLNVIFSVFFIFVVHFDVLGLAFSTSISSIALPVMLYVSLINKKIFLKPHDIYRDVTKIIVSGIIMAALTYVPMKILDQLVFDTTRTINLMMLTASVSLWGMVVYVAASWFFNVEELKVVLALLSKIGNWKKNLQDTTEIVTS